MPQDLLWLNGAISPLAEGSVSVEDRGFNFADGIYEVVLFYNQRPFMLREHLERWRFSAEGLMMEMPGTIDSREQLIHQLVEQSGHRDALVYGQLTRGAATRNHLFPGSTVPPTELWFVRAAPRHNPKHYEAGVKLMTHPDERWVHCQYKSISLLPNVLAKERAHREGAYEALLYRDNGLVTECSASNAFAIHEGVIYTHPLTPRILGGMTRLAVIRAAESIGIEVRQQARTLNQFRHADELFITSTTMQVMPVTKLDNDSIGNGTVGPVTRQVMQALDDQIASDCGFEEQIETPA